MAGFSPGAQGIDFGTEYQAGAPLPFSPGAQGIDSRTSLRNEFSPGERGIEKSNRSDFTPA